MSTLTSTDTAILEHHQRGNVFGLLAMLATPRLHDEDKSNILLFALDIIKKNPPVLDGFIPDRLLPVLPAALIEAEGLIRGFINHIEAVPDSGEGVNAYATRLRETEVDFTSGELTQLNRLLVNCAKSRIAPLLRKKARDESGKPAASAHPRSGFMDQPRNFRQSPESRQTGFRNLDTGGPKLARPRIC